MGENQRHACLYSNGLKTLSSLTTEDPLQNHPSQSIDDVCNRNIQLALQLSVPPFEHSLHQPLGPDRPIRSNYVCSVLMYVDYILTHRTLMSVKDTKIIRKAITIACNIAILPNLLPASATCANSSCACTQLSVSEKYEQMLSTTKSVYNYLIDADLRPLVPTECLTHVLAASFQIIHAPLKKPSGAADESGFIMTRELYDKYNTDKNDFHRKLAVLKKRIHPILYYRSLMQLHKPDAPGFLKRALTREMNEAGLSGDLKIIVLAMLDALGSDGKTIDRTARIIDIVTKIVLNMFKLNRAEVYTTLCNQIVGFKDLGGMETEQTTILEGIYALTLKMIHHNGVNTDLLIKDLLSPLSQTQEEDVTNSIAQTLRLLRLCFVERTYDIPQLDTGLLRPVLVPLFRFRLVIGNSQTLRPLRNDIEDVLLKLLKKDGDQFSIFDSLLFDINSKDLETLSLKGFRISVEDDRLKLKQTEYTQQFSITERIEALTSFIKQHSILYALYCYLLNTLANRDKYFNTSAAKSDLLETEDSFVVNKGIEAQIAVFKLLSELSENKDMQNFIRDDPTYIIKFMNDFYLRTIDTKMNQTSEFESDGFQTIFIVSMILQALLEGCENDQYKSLIAPLKIVAQQGTNEELTQLISAVLFKLEGGKVAGCGNNPNNCKSEVDQAIEDVLDPLLPVRGHGLLTLSKLVEKKDAEALERKQYILNIFQQNLKDTDSFIYLNAIGGLAAMADVFPNTIITTLTEEYSDFSKKDFDDQGHEIRLKLGEVLVRVTKTIGDTVQKYKAVLLNAFLSSAKDDDHLVRTSSLSNLGEVCRVLGYKLGSIVAEILACVHDVITTDKAIEPRRAAVGVIRQLFDGLEANMIEFLKDDILEMYRSLKRIYSNDPDDVMRLQAQLALEELNANVVKFLNPDQRLEYSISVPRLS